MPNIDMVAFMDGLTEGGFSEKQAKALSAAIFQLVESQLVTRDYLDARLGELRLEIARMKSDLIQWMCGIVIVQTGMTAVLFKLLH